LHRTRKKGQNCTPFLGSIICFPINFNTFKTL
jgi:hypothetical protein